MSERVSESIRGISPKEMLGMAGFAFFLGWLIQTFFWFYSDFPVGVPASVSDMSQLAIFIAIALGYVALALLGRKPSFSLFSIPLHVCEVVTCIALPIVAYVAYAGMFVPLPAVVCANILAGLGASMITVSWLDVCGRLKTGSFMRFVGLAFFGGGLLFALCAASPMTMQPPLSIVFALCSIGLLVFTNERADANDEKAPLESVEKSWTFTREVEPAFFCFNIVFALTFVYLFNYGKEALFFGLIAIIPAALIAALIFSRHNISVITTQRILLVVTVLSCVAMPATQGALQLAFSCLVIAAWAVFSIVNYSYLVRKSVMVRDVPTFRQIPVRLAIPACGFAVGWAIAAVISIVLPGTDTPFMMVRTVMAVVLVAVFMMFFPSEDHHRPDGTSSPKPSAGASVSITMDESELFERRCDAIAKLYQLSPRESDVLRYLGRGRNAAWIQDELTISPHTVKSHIYNIYRKLDIHSQQKLMSFIEEYPLDGNSLSDGR